MAKSHQAEESSEESYMSGVEQCGDQETPEVDVQTKISIKNPQVSNVIFVKRLIPTFELTKNSPLGVDTFDELHRLDDDGKEKRYYTIDTTMMIRNVLGDKGFKYLCMLGPRRFGKTLNMSMLECFMDGYCLNNQETKDRNIKLFQGLEISNDKQFCSNYQQKFFIIKFDFSDLEHAFNMQDIEKSIANMLYLAYEQFAKICNQKSFFTRLDMLDNFDSDVPAQRRDLLGCLKRLVGYIREVAKTNADELPQQVALLIDEFDKPYAATMGKSEEFYNMFQSFMNNFLGIKGGRFFDQVFFTGVQPIPFRTSSHSLNGICLISVFDPRFCNFYGFTDASMDQLLKDTGLLSYKNDFKIRFNGYNSLSMKGEPVVSIYNPYSVMASIKHLVFNRYWCSSGTSAESLIDGFKTQLSRMQFCNMLTVLIDEGDVDVGKRVVETPSRDLQYDDEKAWEILVYSGYVQRDLVDPTRVSIPNLEIAPFLFEVIRKFYRIDMIILSMAQQALYTVDMKSFAEAMVDPFTGLPLHSSRNETSYTVLVYMLAYGCQRNRKIIIDSEKNVPGGTTDLVIQLPEGNHMTVYVFELKYLRADVVAGKNTKEVGEILKKSVDEALDQIDFKKYDQPFHKSNVLVKVGITFTANRYLLGYQKMPNDKAQYFDLDQLTERSRADPVPQQAVEHVDESIDVEWAMEEELVCTWLIRILGLLIAVIVCK